MATRLPRKFDTAPARMRSKREVAATWDIQHTAQFFAPPPPAGTAAAASHAEAPHVACHAATLSGMPAYAGGSSADWNAHGSGSWGRVSKRRTSEENSMSLWEVSEALKLAAAPAAAAERGPSPFDALLDAGASPDSSSVDDIGMGLLDALVALEAAGQQDSPSASGPTAEGAAQGGRPTSAPTPSETECAEGDEPILDPDELLAMLHPDSAAVFDAPPHDIPMPSLVDTPVGGDRPAAVWEAREGEAGWDVHPADAAVDAVGLSADAYRIDLDDGPASPSPTSVATLFGEALSGSGGTPNEGGWVDAGLSPKELSAEVSLKLDAAAASEHHAHAGQQQQHGDKTLPHPALDGIAAQFAAPSNSSPSSRNGAERKEWTAAEDEIIRSSMLVHGARWRRIAAQLPGRSDDAVRNRWNRLKDMPGGEAAAAAAAASAPAAAPAIRRTSSTQSEGGSKPERVSWTKTEDATILQSVQELGHKWNKLAERLPGRTDHAIRNRFHRLQTMMEDKQRAQQRALAPSEELPEASL